MTPAAQCVLLVDDDTAIRTVLSAQLKQDGIECVEAASAEEALERLSSGMVDLIVTDLRMPGMDGLELLSRAVRVWPDVPVIVLTAFGSIPVAVDAMRRGAVDFIEKPFDRAGVLYAIRSALGSSRQRGDAPPSSAAGDHLVGDSPAMVELRDSIQRAARASRSTVLIRGENGTGKELVARAVHAQSARASGPFVTINCAAIPESLVEAEIFGYVKGAFTGAVKDKPGRVELAHGGTLFLDEIGDYSEATQVTLLRILAEHEVRRLGARDSTQVDVRFVAATNKDLERAMKLGQFREDLFYRLSVLPIVVPPLSERTADIPGLVRHFLGRSSEGSPERRLVVEREAMELLAERPWPGNVRQLENFVERLVVFTDGESIRRQDVERELRRGGSRSERPASSAKDLASAVRETEQAAIADALTRTNNNRSRAARILGLSRRAFYNKLREYDLLGFRPPYSRD